MGNTYISGYTKGALGGPYEGGNDVFLAKYDPRGSLLWIRQLGTAELDVSYSVALDGSGSVFISGYTFGDLGGSCAGDRDAFLAKYDVSGDLLWTRQLGTSVEDWSLSVAADHSGNAYISGFTYGSLGGASAGERDAFLAKYDASGGLVWTRQLGTSGYDRSFSVAVDALGNAYISGFTDGSLGGLGDGFDAFLAKYDALGGLVWTRQIGAGNFDESWSVAVDELGNAYISGYTDGSLGGPNAGIQDVFLAKFDTSGNLLWTQQLGTNGADWSCSVALDKSGNVYISGFTDGSLGGSNAGADDAFLAKYSPVPEPATISMLAVGVLGVLARRWRANRA